MSNASNIIILHPQSKLKDDVELIFECLIDVLVDKGWNELEVAAAVADQADEFVLATYRTAANNSIQ